MTEMLGANEGSFNQVVDSNAVGTSPLIQDSVHRDSFPQGTPQVAGFQDRAPFPEDPTEDPESPRDIVHQNVLTLFPLALFFVFLFFGLVIAFSE